MKKKILVFSLILAMAAVAVVGGSLAWFADEDAATNVFTIGSVEIVQNEQQRQVVDGEKTNTLEDFVNNKVLLPIVNTDDPTVDVNFADKIVTVTNKGANSAYVQSFVAVPAVLDNANVIEIYENSTDLANWTKTQLIDGDGNAITTTIDNIVCNIYKYVYNTVLTKNATTESLMYGVYINANVDMDVEMYNESGGVANAVFQVPVNGVMTDVNGFNAAMPIKIYVASQAIQSEGFQTAEEALANFGTHPWQP